MEKFCINNLVVINLKTGKMVLATVDHPGIIKIANSQDITPKEFLEGQLRGWEIVRILNETLK